MSNETIVLVAILLVAGYFLVLLSTSRRMYSRNMLAALAIAELLLYFGIICGVGALYVYCSYDPMIIYIALILFAMLGVICISIYFIRNRETNNHIFFVALFLYLCALFYFTLFRRSMAGSVSTMIKMDVFRNFKYAWMTGDIRFLQHDALNTLLFMPLGFLVPLLNPVKRLGSGFATLTGIIISTGIETVQLVARWGECDINDIISNSLGALLGCVLCKLFLWIYQSRKGLRNPPEALMPEMNKCESRCRY
ncbi:MAG: VanZ family protein [Blautia sp.]|nr:VanZ family protein [Blautia sp.]